MATPEQRGISEENSEQLPLIAALSAERDAAGSTAAYITQLDNTYRLHQADRANVLQLERHAAFITNPDNMHADANKNLTSSFYWGELLAHRTAELIIGEQWGAISYKLFNEGLQNDFKTYSDHTINAVQNKMFVSTYLLGELEQPDDPQMPPILDEFIERWALDMTDNPSEQQYLTMGYRYVIKKITQLAAINEFQEIVTRDTTEGESLDIKPQGEQSLEELRKDIINDFAGHYLTYIADKKDITQSEAYDEALDYLTIQINRDFLKKYESLNDEDLVISGKVFCVLVDKTNPTNAQGFILEDNEIIMGQAGVLSVGSIPKITAIDHFHDGLTDTDMNKFGIMLEIKDPVIRSIAPKAAPRTLTQENFSLHVTISYPGVDMGIRLYG